jgi:hypothetical protein
MEALLKKLEIGHEGGPVPDRWINNDIKPIEEGRRTWGFWTFHNFCMYLYTGQKELSQLMLFPRGACQLQYIGLYDWKFSHRVRIDMVASHCRHCRRTNYCHDIGGAELTTRGLLLLYVAL